MAALQGYCDEPLHLENLFNLEKEINQVASASRDATKVAFGLLKL